MSSEHVRVRVTKRSRATAQDKIIKQSKTGKEERATAQDKIIKQSKTRKEERSPPNKSSNNEHTLLPYLLVHQTLDNGGSVLVGRERFLGLDGLAQQRGHHSGQRAHRAGLRSSDREGVNNNNKNKSENDDRKNIKNKGRKRLQ